MRDRQRNGADDRRHVRGPIARHSIAATKLEEPDSEEQGSGRINWPRPEITAACANPIRVPRFDQRANTKKHAPSHARTSPFSGPVDAFTQTAGIAQNTSAPPRNQHGLRLPAVRQLPQRRRPEEETGNRGAIPVTTAIYSSRNGRSTSRNTRSHVHAGLGRASTVPPALNTGPVAGLDLFDRAEMDERVRCSIH